MSQFVERFSQPGYWEELISFNVGLKPRGFKSMAGRSRMNREVHVRFCGGCALQAHGIQLSEMAAAVKLSQQLRTESCVVAGNGPCEA